MIKHLCKRLSALAVGMTVMVSLLSGITAAAEPEWAFDYDFSDLPENDIYYSDLDDSHTVSKEGDPRNGWVFQSNPNSGINPTDSFLYNEDGKLGVTAVRGTENLYATALAPITGPRSGEDILHLRADIGSSTESTSNLNQLNFAVYFDEKRSGGDFVLVRANYNAKIFLGNEKFDTGLKYSAGKPLTIDAYYMPDPAVPSRSTFAVTIEHNGQRGTFTKTLADIGLTAPASAYPYYAGLRMRITAGTQKAWIDNFSYSYAPDEAIEYFRPSLSGINLVDSRGETLSETPNASDVAAIRADFDKSLAADTVNAENVVLYKGDGDAAIVPAEVALEDDSSITVTPQVPLDASSLYRLTVNESVLGPGSVPVEKTEYEFRTAAGSPGVRNGEFTVGGRTITDITELSAGDTVKFQTDVSAAQSENIMTLLVLYRDGRMTDYSVSPDGLTLKETPQSGDVLRGFVWRGGLRPVGTGFVLR